MVLVRRALIVVCALAMPLQTGCADKVTPPSVTDVDLSLTVSPTAGHPSSPVVADALITNVGNTRVLHCEGCGCGNGVELAVLGPDGTRVWLEDPHAAFPACPDGSAPLAPGEDLAGSLAFTGTLYMPGPTVPSPTYPAPAGTYTVVARFRYGTSAQGEWTPLEQRATFLWAP